MMNPKKIFLSDGIYFEDSLFSRNAIYSDYLYIILFHIEPQIKNNENFFFKNKNEIFRYNHSSLIIGNKLFFVGGKYSKANCPI